MRNHGACVFFITLLLLSETVNTANAISFWSRLFHGNYESFGSHTSSGSSSPSNSCRDGGGKVRPLRLSRIGRDHNTNHASLFSTASSLSKALIAQGGEKSCIECSHCISKLRGGGELEPVEVWDPKLS